MTNAWPILALLAPAITGWLLVGAIAGNRSRSNWEAIVRLTTGTGTGLALASGVYFLWRVAGWETGLAYRVFDCLALPVLAAIAYVARRRASEPASSIPKHRTPPLLLLATFVIVVFALIASVRLALAEPIGNWDANAIWNLKARFFHRGGDGDAWTRMFAREIWFSHPDYPLMLPAAIARLWKYLGRETHTAPIALGIGFATLTFAALFAGLACVRSARAACVAVLLLAANETFLWYAGAQVADVPLGFFVLTAVVLLAIAAQQTTALQHTPPPLKLFALAGACAGLAAFVKNEGLAICAMFAVAFSVTTLISRRWKPLAAFLAGMVIGLALVATQKTLFTAETYLTADQPSSAAFIDKILDPDRHRTILSFLARWYFGLREWYSLTEGWRLNQWPFPMPNEPTLLLVLALPLVFGIRIPRHRRPPAIAIGLLLLLVLLTYYAVLLVMPYDLAALVQSLPRYFLHVVPSAIFWVCYVTRWERDEHTPEAAAADANHEPTTAT